MELFAEIETILIGNEMILLVSMGVERYICNSFN